MKRLDPQGKEIELLRQTALRYMPGERLPAFFGTLYFHAHPGDLRTFNAMPFDLGRVQKALRRARLGCDRNGASGLFPPELVAFESAKPPLDDERVEQAMKLSELAAVKLRRMLRPDRPALVRCFADLHVFAEFLHRRLLGV